MLARGRARSGPGGCRLLERHLGPRAIPTAVDPHRAQRSSYADRRLHELLRQELSRAAARPGARLLEVGCARSRWLPYFASELGFAVTGLDYSEIGCEQERALLAAAGVGGEVVCADVFSPPKELLGSFDGVVSFGVVEHFEDTAAILAAIARLARPGGVVVTQIPNFSGLLAPLMRALNRRVYDTHVPLSAAALRQAHERAGLRVTSCGYFLSTGFGVLNNLSGLDPADRATRVRAGGLKLLRGASRAVWALEEATRPLPATGALAPYIVCTAGRPEVT